MDKLKRFIAVYKIQVFDFLILVSVAPGIYVGFITVDRYPNVVNAALGISVVYLLIQKALPHKKLADEPEGIHVEFPRDLKYMGYAFVSTILMFWSGVQVLHLFGI